MRQIFLDTETTGLETRLGHRIIEIGCVEMQNRRLTDVTFHCYLNPERDIDEGALAVHGLDREFLADKPLFAHIAAEFLAFIEGAELLIHNAPFDLGFLNAELERLAMPPIQTICPDIVDTLAMARELHPGKRNRLDALCERYGVDNARRTLHGALLDAEILADVYLAMTRGQESLIADTSQENQQVPTHQHLALKKNGSQRLIKATETELAEHEKYLATLNKESKGKCLWLKV